MFSARNISAEIGARKILNNVSLDIKAGEVIAVLGANGAGKSTLLKALCSDIRISDGEIFLEERGLSEWNYHELARKRAVLSQHLSLSFPLKAREVALLGRNPHVRGSESPYDLEVVGEALELVEVAHLAEQSFPTLSGGEQQRVHLARILAQIWELPENSARYLLLDEPTASLDLAHQHLTLQIARKLSRAETGVLVILHDLNLAARYADRICLMKNGAILHNGTPAKILTAANIKNVFDFDVSLLEHEGLPLIVPKVSERFRTAVTI